MSVKIRNIDTHEEGSSGMFNISSICEIIVYFNDWMDTDYQKRYEVFIEAIGKWIPFREAFRDNHLIVNNHNTCFFEPTNEEDRKRGFTL